MFYYCNETVHATFKNLHQAKIVCSSFKLVVPLVQAGDGIRKRPRRLSVKLLAISGLRGFWALARQEEEMCKGNKKGEHDRSFFFYM